jgi:hypothetical protein
VIALSTLAWWLVLILALAGLGCGLMAMFAGGMSDSPGEGQRMGRQGCAIVMVALIIGALAIWRLVA